MIKIILGTTPTIKYTFKIVKPAGIETVIIIIQMKKWKKNLEDLYR